MKPLIPEDLRGRTRSMIVVVCTGIALAIALLHLKNILTVAGDVLDTVMPFFIGFAIAFLLLPIVNRMDRLFNLAFSRKKPHPKLSRILATLIAYIVLLTLLTGFFAILVLSGLQFISGDLYEAARVDGAGPVRSFFSITLPLIKKNLLTLCIFFTMWRLTSFDVVYSMTAGGPADATSLLAYRISMEAFSMLNLGYASALAVFLFVVMAILSLINVYFISRIDR